MTRDLIPELVAIACVGVLAGILIGYALFSGEWL